MEDATDHALTVDGIQQRLPQLLIVSWRRYRIEQERVARATHIRNEDTEARILLQANGVEQRRTDCQVNAATLQGGHHRLRVFEDLEVQLVDVP